MRHRHDLFKGGISILKMGFRATFFNPILDKEEVIGVFDTEDLAKDSYTKRQYEFYKENRYLLPRGIGIQDINTHKKPFQASISIKGKVVYLGIFSNIQDAEKYRKDIIVNLF